MPHQFQFKGGERFTFVLQANEDTIKFKDVKEQENIKTRTDGVV